MKNAPSIIIFCYDGLHLQYLLIYGKKQEVCPQEYRERVYGILVGIVLGAPVLPDSRIRMLNGQMKSSP